MSAAPEALVLDDGELDDVVELLGTLGLPPELRRGGRVPAAAEPPTRLLVATPRRAVAHREWAERSPRDGPIHIAVVEEDSNALRAMLRRMGFHYLVRRPVHPYALRLLLLRALYSGSERRREARRPVGFAVDYRMGRRRGSAILAELSLRGGRLLTDRPLPPGRRIQLQIPRAVTGERPLGLRAKVVRCTRRERGEHAVALVFEEASLEVRRRLSAVLRRRAEGPASLPKGDAATPAVRHDRASGPAAEGAAGAEDDAGSAEPAAEAEPPAAAADASADRRKHPRAAFAGAIEAASEEAERVLVGRDLSVGGMRVDACELEPGARLRVALYPAAREEAIVLDAEVVRSGDGSGAGLRFDSVPPEEAARLEALVAGLPAVEALEGGEAEALGSVVSEIVERHGEGG